MLILRQAIARALGSSDAANQRREVLLTTTNDDDKRQCTELAHRIATHRTACSPLALEGLVVQGWPAGHTHHSLLVGHFLATSTSLLDQETVRGAAPARHQHRSTSATALHRYRASLVLVPASSIFRTSQQSSLRSQEHAAEDGRGASPRH